MTNIDKKLLDNIINMKTLEDMVELLKYGNSEREYIKGKIIIANNKMDKGLSYVLEENMGDITNTDFNPYSVTHNIRF